jgi:guanylate kinase
MIILTGPSASGKTATCLYLQAHYGIRKVITHTTRPIRAGETNDVDYHFVSIPEFEALKKEDFFVETVFYNGNFYGTSRKEVQIDKCMAVELNGARTYSQLKNPHIVIFYMEANEKTRHDRMVCRGDTPEKICSRLSNDEQAFTLTDATKTLIDDYVDTEKYDIDAAADYIYHHYIAILAKRGIDFFEKTE